MSDAQEIQNYEARVLEDLIRQLHERHAETMAHRDTAFAAMADTRKSLAAMSAERGAAQQEDGALVRGARC